MTDKPFAKVLIICGVVVKRDGKYLLVKEKREDIYGLWGLPAGRVDEGESLEEAAIREAKEETGYDVRLLQELLLQHPSATEGVLHAYEAEIIGGDLHFPSDDLLDAGWFSYEEIIAMKDSLRSPEYTLTAIQKVEQR